MARTTFSWTRFIFGLLLGVLALSASGRPVTAIQDPEVEKVVVNRTVPDVSPPPALPVFSGNPSELEFLRARVFDEPLVAVGGTPSAEENRSLANAVLAYLRAGIPESTEAIEQFLTAHPQSPWRTSLLTGLGVVWRRTGYFSKALEAWEAAWAIGRSASTYPQKAIADRALGELAELSARLGRYERLEQLLQDIEERDVTGSASEKVAGARRGLWLMENEPGQASRCGPMALDRILAYGNASYVRDDLITDAQSTAQGTSLAQMHELANDLGMKMQVATRSPGAEVIVPALVHWKVGHFAAIVDVRDGRYLVQDPTFGDELWVSESALDEEGSGAYLVRTGDLPDGWTSSGQTDASKVWGKGFTNASDPEATTEDDDTTDDVTCGPGGPDVPPMAVYRIHLMLANLNIRDEPVGYHPPFGPSPRFRVTYNHREIFQPQVFYYSNLGPKWTFDWLSHIEDDPANPNASVFVYRRGGGRETHSGFDSGTQSYLPHIRSRAIVTRTGVSPVSYQRELPNGSLEIFGLADGASSLPRRVFMTEWRDPQGNAVSFTYDSNLRLVAATDAIGQVTTLRYDDSLDPLKITSVVDPFGRSVIFEYDNSRLVAITDVINLRSEFTYGDADFITSMTTPYGTTEFRAGDNGLDRFVEVTDPLGGKERVEYLRTAAVVNSDPIVPTGIAVHNSALIHRNTFYWNKRAMELFPGDLSKAYWIHWQHSIDINITAAIRESEKAPLENRVWYNYPGSLDPAFAGSSALPSAAARVLDDGVTQLVLWDRNSRGHIVSSTDPVGRQQQWTYAANDVDLVEVRQTSNGISEVLGSYTYSGQHRPLSYTGPAGQTVIFTYNDAGQVETITERNGETTTFTYDPQGNLLSVAAPLGLTTSFTYDAVGRVQTSTDSDGYTVILSYDDADRVTRVLYPDGSEDEFTYNRLDAEVHQDRLGRSWYRFFDPLRRLVAERDPLGRTTTFEWCSCGALERMVDGRGNETRWERDAQGRIVLEVRADGATRQFAYEATTSGLASYIDAKGQTTRYEYDVDDNLLLIDYVDSENPTPDVSFAYDPNYDRVLSMTDGFGSTQYTYHPIGSGLGAGLLAAVDGPLPNDAVSYEYDEMRRERQRGIDSVFTTLTYDAIGRVTQELNALGLFVFAYDSASSRLSSITYPNGQTSTYSYLPTAGDNRLAEIHHRVAAGGSTLSRFEYSYDAEGNISTWRRQRGPAVPTELQVGHDRANQLTDVTEVSTDGSGAVLSRFRYSYDATGNRTVEQLDDAPKAATYDASDRLVSQQLGGDLRVAGNLSEPASVQVQNLPATVNATNEFQRNIPSAAGTNTFVVTAVDASGNQQTNTYQTDIAGGSEAFSYDANGNLVSDGLRTYEWDGNDRLTAVQLGTARTEYGYDGRGRRVRLVRLQAGAVVADTRFVPCGTDLCEARDAVTGTVLRRFYRNGEEQLGQPLFYTRDHLNSVRELTDMNGAVRAQYDYDAFGRSVLAAGDLQASHGFAGHYSHPGDVGVAEEGLIYAKARYYSPTLGRFLSEDPVAVSDGRSRYHYALNNPLSRVDPFGLTVMVRSRPVQGFFGWLGNHTWVVVTDENGETTYSGDLEEGGDLGVKRDYSADKDVAERDVNGEQVLPPPPGMSQEQWDKAVRESGEENVRNYHRKTKYHPWNTSNSVTAKIIEEAGGGLPSDFDPEGPEIGIRRVPWAVAAHCSGR